MNSEIPLIVKEGFTKSDLQNIKNKEWKVIGHNVIQALPNIIPHVGGLVASLVASGYSFHEANFFRNFLEIIFNIQDTSLEDRDKFMSEIEDLSNDYAGNVLTNIISKIDNINKGTIIANLIRAEISKQITIEDFFRLVMAIERIPFTDIKYLKEFEKPNYIRNGVTEILYAAGTLFISTIDAENGNLFLLSELGYMLLKYGLNIDCRIVALNSTDIIQIAYNESKSLINSDDTVFLYDAWRGK